MTNKQVQSIEALPPVARRFIVVTAICSLVLACMGLAAVAFGQNKETTNPAVRRSELFHGSATLKDKAGKPKTARIATENWMILGSQHLEDFPEHGFLVVRLLSGKVTTVIGGETKKRQPGEFWVVPANARMAVDAKGEVTGLEVTTLNVF